MSLEDYLTPSSRFGWVVYIIVLGAYIDLFYNGGQSLTLAIIITRQYETVLTLAFSGLLVVLYWEQHQMQKEQADIASRQVEIQKQQIDLMEAKEEPSLWIEDCTLSDLPADQDVAQSDPYWARTIVVNTKIKNQGQGPAYNLRVEGLFYFSRQDESGGYFHSFEPFGVRLRGTPFAHSEGFTPNMLNKGIGETLEVGETKEVSAASPLALTPYGGPATKEEPEGPAVSSHSIPIPEVHTLGEAIEGFYFEIEEVAMEVYVRYDSATGESSRELLDRRVANAKEVESVEDLAEKGNWIDQLKTGESGSLWQDLNLRGV